jgi:hypothetical protein
MIPRSLGVFATDSDSTAQGYRAEVDRIDRAGWSESLKRYEDTTIYQTWSYGAVRWGESRLSHFLLRRGGRVVGLAQVTVVKAPLFRVGIGYVPWGPLWRKRGERTDIGEMRQLLRGLKEEYVTRRGLLLRVTPNEVESRDPGIRRILEEEGFVLVARPYRTLLIDLSQPLDDLLKKASRRWQRALKSARSKRLEIVEGTGDDLFRIVVDLHREMVERKKFRPGIEIAEFREIQKDLPDTEKMKVMVCLSGGKPVSALCASLIGEKGIGLVGGTGAEGLSTGSFHFLNWRMLECMKEAGARYYDFGGYNPEKNPGTASFKEGLPGQDAYHIGQYEACPDSVGRFLVKFGEFVRNSWRETGNRH